MSTMNFMRKFFTTNKRYAGRFFMASASLCIISVNLMMSSCQEDSSFLGYDLLDNSDSLASTIDTLSVSLSNVEADSVVALNSIATVVGNYNDPLFGNSSASTILQFGMFSFNDTFKLDSTATAIKAEMTLYRYFSFNKPKESLKINVYMVSTRIYDTVSYASNIDPTKLISTKIGSKILLPTDSIFEIELPDVASLFKAKDLVINNMNFVNKFKGVYLEAEKVGANGDICTFDREQSKLDLSYTSKLSKSKTDTTKIITLVTNINRSQPYSGMANVNYYKHSANQHLANDSVLYISGLAGYRVKASFPTLKTIMNDKKIFINKAELIVQADTSLNTIFPYSNEFNMYRYGTTYYEPTRDFYKKVLLNRENLELRFDIMNQIQDYISGKNSSPDFYIQPFNNDRRLTQTRLLNKYGKKAKLRILYSRLR